jgi:hypothetical protein
MSSDSRRMRSHVQQLFLLLCCFFAFGCTSFSDGAFRQIDGRFFDDRLVENIVDGQTREEQILAWFGSPESVLTSDTGIKTMRYHSIRTRRSVERRLFSKKIYEQTVEQELILTSALGLVTSHQYRSRTY